MVIKGFLPTSFLDYPGKIASVVFTGGCNFRCPFCHNRDLVLDYKAMEPVYIDEVMAHLRKRRKVIEGICISGGEPTLQKGLISFIDKVKELDVAVKLDTNGYEPSILKILLGDGYVDYVAMDVKNSPSKYAVTSGVKGLDMGRIYSSIDLLINGHVPYEFRTTVIKELHTIDDIKDIGSWINGANRYCLQQYSNMSSQIGGPFTSYDKEFFLKAKDMLIDFVDEVVIRGC